MDLNQEARRESKIINYGETTEATEFPAYTSQNPI